MRLGGFNKYRNATAAVAGREAWYSELSLDVDVSVGSNGLAIDDGNLYVKTANGSSLQVLSVDQPGRVGSRASVLPSSTGRLVDWSASHFEDGLVIGGDEQGVVSLWKDGALHSAFTAHSSACVSAAFHPTVAELLATSSSAEVKLWNASSRAKEPLWSCGVEGGIDSVSIRGDGQLVAVSTHTGMCAVYDPRQNPSSSSLAGSTPAFHAPGRPTRVIFLGEKPFFISTGLAKMRERSAALWDQRNLAKPLASLQLQPSTKPLIPLYDEDTQLAYLVEKGDTIVRWLDADPSSSKPLTEFGSVALPSQISGCALLPKCKLNVMSGEIARIHVLAENAGTGTGTAAIPISHIAPRRSYLDFHSDLFPDTRAPLPAQTLGQWIAQEPASVPKVSLDPAKAADALACLHTETTSQNASLGAGLPASKKAVSTKRRQFAQPDHARFKYLEGFLYRPSEHFSNLHDVNVRFPQENDMLKVSSRFVAIAISGTGGQIGIMRRDSPGRAPTKMPTIVHGAAVVDMEFDPFDPSVVATAGSDTKLYLWRIPDTPLTEETAFDLEEYIHVTADRIHQIRFHPCAKGIVGVLVSDSGESAVYVYHGLMLHFIVGKTSDGMHSFAWSPDGERIAVATKKSRKLRVYNVHSQELLYEGPSMDSIRPCRAVWLDNDRVCLAGFGIGSQRQIAIYSISGQPTLLARKTIDVGPGILAPIVDRDCSVLYLDDRGSRLTHAFEVVGGKLVELPKHESSQPSLCLAVLPKKHADAAKCELIRAYRLNTQSIESMGFRVPRKRPEYFQDEIFPDTLDCETPSVDAIAWVGGAAATPQYIGLCPPGMTPLSDAPPEVIRKPKLVFEMQQEVDNTKDAINAML
ncbi:DUF1900-domain-containing protein, partial [Martensiomyces pterosporus]